MTRRFESTSVDVDLVVSLIDDARRAPSAGFAQGASFLVLTGDSVTDFWERTGAGEWFLQRQPGVLAAPMVIVAVADAASYTQRYSEADKRGHGLETGEAWPVPFWLTDTAMATQNLLLLLEDEGLGALFFGIFRNERDLLDHHEVGASSRALGAIAVGLRSAEDRPSGSSTVKARVALSDVARVRR